MSDVHRDGNAARTRLACGTRPQRDPRPMT